MKKRSRRKDFEIKFYETLIQKRPNFVQALASLGDAYTRRGFYQEGLAVDQRLVKLKPQDPFAYYNLACSLSLVGQIAQSRGQLTKAVRLGYNDFAYIWEDPDLENLRNSLDFDSFFADLKKLKSASVE